MNNTAGFNPKTMDKKSSVIVIEDDQDISSLIDYNLKKNGFPVERVFDGDDALELLAQRHFDIVILDIMLPGISGLEICQKLKQAPGSEQPFVIIISAKTSAQDKLCAHIIGADGYLAKPFGIDYLINMVKEFDEFSRRDFFVRIKE